MKPIQRGRGGHKSHYIINAARQSATIFSTTKSNFIFLIAEARCNFHNELFDSVEAQRNSGIEEWDFCTKSRRNPTSAIEILQRNIAFFAILDRNRVNNLLKKADIYEYYDRYRTKLSSMFPQCFKIKN